MEPLYIPTPDEIANATAKIRASWSDKERAHRAAGRTGRERSAAMLDHEHWSPPTVSVRDLPLAVTLES